MKGPSIKDVRKSGGGVRQKRTWGYAQCGQRGQNVADVFYGWPLIVISFLANFIFTIFIIFLILYTVK